MHFDLHFIYVLLKSCVVVCVFIYIYKTLINQLS